MRQKKIKILVGILLALVLFASSVALLMYSKQNELTKYVESHIEVYVVNKSLSRGQMVGIDDLKMVRLPKSYIDFTPLTKEELLGRYVTKDMLASEPLRPSKLSLVKPVEEKEHVKTVYVEKEKEQKIKQLSSDTIAVPLSIFKNLDTSLKNGDFIDIVSVSITSASKKKKASFKTKYIALHVPIRSFVSHAKPTGKMLIESLNEETQQVNMSLADTVVLDMSPNDIKNFLPMYYQTQALNAQRVYMGKKGDIRGHLWMVKCSDEVDAQLQKEKERLLVDAKRKAIKRARKAQSISISYEK